MALAGEGRAPPDIAIVMDDWDAMWGAPPIIPGIIPGAGDWPRERGWPWGVGGAEGCGDDTGVDDPDGAEMESACVGAAGTAAIMAEVAAAPPVEGDGGIDGCCGPGVPGGGCEWAGALAGPVFVLALCLAAATTSWRFSKEGLGTSLILPSDSNDAGCPDCAKAISLRQT